MEVLIAIGVLFWAIGFLGVGRTVEDGLLVNKTFVRPPFLYILFAGYPNLQIFYLALWPYHRYFFNFTDCS